ncbi:MAG: hypothetical protein VKJ44_00055 [Synechococcus sp.]|nr:hypothetical protein [Synechococcus sp.]
MAPSAVRRGLRPTGRPGLLSLLGCSGLLLSAAGHLSAARAGEIQATAGALGLGSQVNGIPGGSCSQGNCAISGGTAAGTNLFHRFSSFDSRGAITGVTIDARGFRHVVLGVIHPLGTFLDKPLQLSGGADLIWLSPGGIQLSGAHGFTGMAQLSLSTASSLQLGEGRFDALRTPAGQAAGLNGSPLAAGAGLSSDPAGLQAIGLNRNGDLSLAGGLLTVDSNLLLDAQAGGVQLQTGQIQAASIAVRGQNVAQNASLTALGSAARVELSAAGNLLASAPIRAIHTGDTSGERGGAIVLRAGGNLIQTEASQLQAAGQAGGGSIAVQAGAQLFSSGRYDARGLAAGARGGEIELSGPSLLLRSARAEASGGGGGGAVRIGAGWQGAALRHGGSRALNIDINAGTTLTADAQERGHGGEVVVWSDGQARFAGSASARGGAGGGDGGAIEVSGKATLQFSGRADAGATTGQAGRLLLDPQTLIIDAQAPASGTAYSSVTLADPNPGSLQAFASSVAVLANGDIVATDPEDDLLAPRGGAVYQFRPDGALVATLYGQSAFDRVGRDGITLLSQGNYVVSSSSWNLPGGAAAVGAATWRSADSRDSVAVSPANSLVGSSADDNVSSGGIQALTNGNYVVISPRWDLRDSNGGLSAADAGAVTWGNGSGGTGSGAVSSANSRTGSTAQDFVGSGGVTALSDGHYVIASPLWNLSDSSGNLLAAQAGAATWATGSAGSSGPVAASNSLIGGASNDRAASGGVIDLGNSNYVVLSPEWNLLDPALAPQLVPAAGAATLVPGAGPHAATISRTNSLTGSRSNDRVGSSGLALAQGDFVIGSPGWDGFDVLNNPISDAGAATFSSGRIGSATVGPVDSSNSLVGFSAGDLVSSGGLIALRDGGYVVSSPDWNRSEGSIAPLMPQAGAASFGPAGRGVQGGINAGNSLIGGRAGDRISSGGVVALNPGGYVVSSPLWDRIDPQRGTLLAIDAGAASHGDGTTGVVGLVDPFRHSLVGSLDNDLVSSGGITALSSGGRHVVSSPAWNLPDGAGNPLFAAAGAATWVDPGLGRSPTLPGVVSSQNSLVGSGAGHSIGSGGVVALRDGNYVVSSPLFDLSDPAGDRQDVGAATWGNGLSGSSGFVSATNSLIGGSPGDSVSSGGVFALSRGLFLVSSPNWDLPATQTAAAVPDAGAASGGNASLAGPVALSNSLTGRSSGERYSAAAAGTPAVISSGDAFLINTNNASSSSASLGRSGLLQLGRAYPYSPSDPLLAGFGAGAGQINAGDYAGAAITISPQTIAAIATSGTPVFLQASGDLFLNPGATIDLASPSITPGSLTLEAGRTLRLDASIFSRGSDIRLRANQSAASSPGDRPSGAGELLVGPGVQLDARGSGGDGQLELTVGPARTDGSQPAGALRLQGATLQAADIRLSGSLAVELVASRLNARQSLTISNTPGNAEVATGTAGVSISASQLVADSLLAIGGSPARSSSSAGSAVGVHIGEGSELQLLGPAATLSIEGKGGRGVHAAGIEILSSSLRLAAANSAGGRISLSGLGGQAGSDSSFLAGIRLGQGTLLESGAGSINLSGSGGGGGGGGGTASLPDSSRSFHGGIQLADAVLSSDSGDILITARGGRANQGSVDGLQLSAASGPTPTRISSGSGSITIDAVAGGSDSGSGSGARIGEAPSGGGSGGGVQLQTNGGGAIRISATGNQLASATGSGNVGLLLGDQASILGSGAIELLGSGGFGLNDNHGISAAAGSQIRSQAPSAATAADPLWLRGLRGSASGSNNHGLQLLGTISREAGSTDPANPDLLLEGLGSSQSAAAAFAGDSNNIGVFLAGTISSSAADSRVVIRGEADGLGRSAAAAGGNTGVWIDRTAVLRIGAIPTAAAPTEPQAVLAISGSGSPRSGGQDNRGLHLAGDLSVAGGLQIRATGGSGRDGNRGFQQASGATIELLGHLPTTGGYSGLALDIEAGSGQTSGDGNQAVLFQGQTDIRSRAASRVVGTVASGGRNANSGIEITSEGPFANGFSSLGFLAFRGVGSGQASGNHGFLSTALLTSAGLAIEGTGGGGGDSNSGITAFQFDPLSSSAPLWQISTPAGADALTLLGSGAGSGDDNVGVQLAAAVQVSGGGRTSISGSGGSGVAGNSGVILANPLTGLSSRPVLRGFHSDGPIRISGSRGDASGSGNLGVAIRTPLSSSAPASAGTASLSVSGGDGAAPPGRTPTNDNVGLLIETGGSVSAAASSAAIELTGVGRGSGAGNHGILVSGEGLDNSGQPIPIWGVESAGGGTAIRLNGTAPATGTDQAVLLQGSALSASAGGNIEISSSGAPITQQSGRVSIQRPGTLQISGAPFTWLAGTLAGDGDITSSAGILLPGAGERWLAGPSLTLNDATLAAGLLRLSSGRLDLTGGFASLVGSALQVDGGAELRSVASANIAGRFDVARGGRVTIRGGDFGLHGGGSDTGAIYLVEAGATGGRLIWNSDRLLLGDNSYQSANGGLYELAGGRLLSPASLRFGGDLLLSGGTIQAGAAVVVTPVGPGQPGDVSPGGPGPGSATGDPQIRDEGGGGTPVPAAAASVELSGAYTQRGGSISGFNSIGIASPGPLTISGGSIRSAPGGSIRIAGRSTDPQAGVDISQADLDSSSDNGNGGLIAIDAASIRLNRSRLRSSGALSGGSISIGVSPDAASGPPATLSIQQSDLIAESVAIAGRINIYGQNIEVIGSNLHLNGAEAGALTAGGAGTGSLLLDRDSEIRLSYNAPLTLGVAPGGSPINDARILRSGAPPPPSPPPQPACQGSSCPPGDGSGGGSGGGSGSERLRRLDGVATALDQSLARSPLHTQPRLSSQGAPAPQPARPGSDRRPAPRLEISTASFTPMFTAAITPDRLPGFPGAAALPAGPTAPVSQGPVETLSGEQLRRRFDAETAAVQEETARRLGLAAEELAVPPTLEELQQFLGRITQWMRSQERNGSCSGGQGPCP